MEAIATKVVSAARAGDAEQVVELAKSNPFIPASVCLEPALLTACEFGQLAVVRACIIELKCNPNCVDKSGRSPLHMAVLRKSNGKIAISILRFLVEHGAKIRKSVLHVCCNDFAVFPLIELKADINAKSVDSMTPIAVAVAADRHEVVAELLRAKCEISSGLIFKAKSPALVHELVRYKVDVNARDVFNHTPLQYAVEANDKRLARALLQAKADPSLVTVSDTDSVASGCVLSFQEILRSMESIASFLADQAQIEDVSKIVSSSAADWQELETVLTQMVAKTKEIKARIPAPSSTDSLCTICKSELKTVVLMPCRHFCVCASCSKALRNGGTWDSDLCRTESSDSKISSNCPICRGKISDYVPVYT